MNALHFARAMFVILVVALVATFVLHYGVMFILQVIAYLQQHVPG